MGFKRESARYASGGDGGAARKTSSGGGYSKSSSGKSYGNKSSSGGAGQKKSNFQYIGSMTLPKSMTDDAKDFVMENLRGNPDVKYNIKVYLPKGVESLTLKSGDYLTVSHRVSEKDPDFVVGKLLLPNSDE